MILPSFGLEDEHVELRSILRDPCTRYLAPHSAQVDDQGTFPGASLRAHGGARLRCITIPEQYGGEGADHPFLHVSGGMGMEP